MKYKATLSFRVSRVVLIDAVIVSVAELPRERLKPTSA
jgi:hypothetical protein